MWKWAVVIVSAMGVLAESARGGGLLYVDDSAPGTGDGASWDGALSSLQAALEIAGDPQNGVCEIRIAQGVYRPTARIDPDDPRSVTFQMIDGVALRGGYAGVGAPDPDARDIDLYPTILSGDVAGNDGAAGTFLNYEENAYHVVLSLATSATALLDGVTITAGSGCCGLGQIDPRGYGGGVFHDGAAQFLDCTFTLNQAANRGGGFYNDGGAPMFARCSFTRNRATDAYADGGGLYCQNGQVLLAFCTFGWNEAQAGGGFFATSSTIHLFECVFEHNRALTTAGKGGAGWLGGCELSAVDCTFQQNQAGRDEGALGFYDGTVSLTGCWFIGNSAADYAGALGLYAVFRLTDCHFVDNFADNGGALDVIGDIEIRGCEFKDNGAVYRGGAINGGGLNAPALIADSVFFSNTAGFDSGAIDGDNIRIERCQFIGNATGGWGGAIRAGDEPLTVEDSRFDNNWSHDGGAVFAGSDLSLRNCEFRGNQAVHDGGAVVSGGPLHAVNCLFVSNHGIDPGRGGALRAYETADFFNCTFAGNTAGHGGGVYAAASFPMTVNNCVFWGNLPNQIHDPGAQTTVRYTNIEGGWPGQGSSNINLPPAFVNPAFGDYRLAPESPCIDAGSSVLWPSGFLLDLADEARILDDPLTPDTGQGSPAVIDMGAYEFQTASPLCVADCALPHDGMVDVNDLLALVSAWGATGVHPADVNGDGVVNANDLLLVIAAWGPCPT